MNDAETTMLAAAANLNPPCLRLRTSVNKLRHFRMDNVKFDASNNDTYFSVYLLIMTSIAADYPLLSGEVKRQVAKKKRWQLRREMSEQSAT